MTDTPSAPDRGHPDDSHLDDEAISATVDGAGWPAHLAGCPACLARRGQLEAAARLVAEPVDPSPQLERERILRMALAARPRGRPPILRIAAVAAAVVAVLATGLLIPALRDSGDQLVGQGVEVEDQPMGGSAAGLGGAGDTGGAVAADLGDFDDVFVLESRLRALFGEGGGARATSDGGSESMAPAAGGDGAESSGGDPQPFAGTCEADARALAPAGADLAYSATMSWRGQAGWLHVYIDSGQEDGEGSLTRQAVVLRRSDCEVLVVQSF